MIVFDVLGVLFVVALIGLGLQTFLKKWESRKQAERWKIDMEPDATPPDVDPTRAPKKRARR